MEKPEPSLREGKQKHPHIHTPTDRGEKEKKGKQAQEDSGMTESLKAVIAV